MVLNAPEVSPEDREKTDITILQGNISQYRKWDDAYEKEILDTYKRLYKKAAAEEPDIIIWPETSLPAALNTNPQMKSYIKKLSETGTGSAYNLIGAVENSRGRYYNSAYLVKPTGDILTPYRKLHLVPFGEFIPFRKFLSPFISVVNETGDFSSGDSYRLLKAGKVKIATGICFEDVFPRLTGKFISKGANVYVNITNDGWYLKSAGAYQHFAHSVFRAVENRIYVIRAANTGISAIISPYGRIEKKTELLTEETFSKNV
jgi:apolipoprotein N-acyltransferase